MKRTYAISLLPLLLAPLIANLLLIPEQISPLEASAIGPSQYYPSVSHPPDVQYTFGQTGHSITWTVADSYAGAGYSITQNAVVVATGTWTSGTPIPINVDGLSIGTYNYVITATDSYAYTGQDTVVVTVVANVAPVISQPPNVQYTFGQTGKSIIWTITDSGTATTSFTIYLNGSVDDTGSWTSGTPIDKGINGMAIGSYNFTIVAIDGLGGTSQDTVIVDVIANVAPTISSPAGFQYPFAQTGNTITWTITDAGTATTSYSILRNASSAGSGSWTSGVPVIVNVDGLAIGSYGYEIVAADGLGASSTGTVIVNVVNAPPTVTNPADTQYTVGQTGKTITWTLTDLSTGTTSYSILRNASGIDSGSWTTGVPVTVGIDGLSIGSYGYEIVAADGLGGSVLDIVIVNVIANVPPAISSPAAVQYPVGQTGNKIPWTLTDAGTGVANYTVYRNGTAILMGSWTSGIPVDINVDGLAVGSYNYTIVATDGLGSSVRDTVLVNVVASPAAVPGNSVLLTLIVLFGSVLGLAPQIGRRRARA